MDDSEYARLLRRTMADLTETASHSTDIDTTLRGVTGACVDLIQGTDSADILVISESDQYQSLAATSELPRHLDKVQEEFREGPCVNAASGDAVVRCEDLEEDARWPRFAKSAVAAGVNSMLSFRLFTHDDRAAALNILGLQPHCFGHEAEALELCLPRTQHWQLSPTTRSCNSNRLWPAETLLGKPRGESWNASTSAPCAHSN